MSDTSVDPAEGPVRERGGLRAALSALYENRNDFDFTRMFRAGLAIGVLIMVISVASLLTRGLNLGIDFEGGGVWEVPVSDVSIEDARDTMTGVGESGAKIQLVTNPDGTELLRVQADVAAVEHSGEITEALAGLAGVDTNEVSVSTVGPSWGDEITRQARQALVVFFVLVTLYIAWRLEWKMALGAFVSMVHDLLLSVGVYSVFQIEITPATVISFLTILGYSLYDTIVVFDRALENSARVVSRTPYRVIMNRTLNQTLMRSINTTVSTILPIGAMLLIGSVVLGAETLEEFALALFIGLASGAYSSLFVAAPLVSYLKEREPKFAYEGEDLTATRTATVGGEVTPRPARRGAPRAGGPATPTGAIPPRPRKTKKRR